jgi:uncharacterized coiled-coil protein SlyX
MEIVPGGLSSRDNGFTMTDDEWYFSRRHMIHLDPPSDPNQRMIITRPALPDAPTSVQVSVFAQRQQEYLSIMHNYEKLKGVIVDVLGPTIIKSMITEARPLHTITIADILTFVSRVYGITTFQDILYIKAQCNEKCNHETDFYLHTRRLVTNFELLRQNEMPVPNFDQQEYLKATTSHLPNVAEAIRDYIKKFPMLRQQNFEAMVMDVQNNIVNNIDTARHQSQVNAAINATMIGNESKMDKLEAMILVLTKEIKQLKSSKVATPAVETPVIPDAAPTAKPKKYCFNHGYNRTHAGKDCLVMKNNGTSTPAQINAQGPALIDGVQGHT